MAHQHLIGFSHLLSLSLSLFSLLSSFTRRTLPSNFRSNCVVVVITVKTHGFYRKDPPKVGVQKSDGVSLAMGNVLDIGTKQSPRLLRSIRGASVAFTGLSVKPCKFIVIIIGWLVYKKINLFIKKIPELQTRSKGLKWTKRIPVEKTGSSNILFQTDDKSY